MIVGRGTARYSTNSAFNRSAPSRSIRKIRKTCGSALVSRGRATAFPLARESISRPMAVKRGRGLAWRNPSALRRSKLARQTAIWYSLRFLAPCGAIRRTAVCTKPRMAARHGSKFSRERIFRRVAQTWQSTPRIPISCSLRCGISGAKAGSTAPVATVRPRPRRADCSVPLTAEIPGPRSRPMRTRVSQRNRMAGSR